MDKSQSERYCETMDSLASSMTTFVNAMPPEVYGIFSCVSDDGKRAMAKGLSDAVKRYRLHRENYKHWSTLRDLLGLHQVVRNLEADCKLSGCNPHQIRWAKQGVECDTEDLPF